MMIDKLIYSPFILYFMKNYGYDFTGRQERILADRLDEMEIKDALITYKDMFGGVVKNEVVHANIVEHTPDKKHTRK